MKPLRILFLIKYIAIQYMARFLFFYPFIEKVRSYNSLYSNRKLNCMFNKGMIMKGLKI